MSVTSLSGAFGFAPQSAKSTAGTTFYWYKAYNIDYGVVIDERPLPQEIGDSLVPTGAFRASAYSAGGLDFTPRLEDDFGWLLAWVMGEDGVASEVVPGSSAPQAHTWTLDGTENALSWGTVHVMIPEATDKLGIVSIDNKVSMLRVTVPQTGLVTARMDLAGRLFDEVTDNIFENNASGAGWTPAFEDFDSTPVAAKTTFKIDGVSSGNALEMTGVTMDFVNGLTTPQQEMTVGSYSPDDFTAVSRNVTVRGTYKWPSDAFFRQIVGGSAGATTFSDEVFKGSAEIQMKAPKEITGAYEYSLTLDFPNVVFQMTNPRLAGANIITTDIIGTAVATAGSQFMTAVLQNGSTAGPYTWPT